MLRELRIRDVAIIEDLEVQFASGLNVISGETGAGKSIILGALGLVLGARSSGDLVRTGSESAEVQARVDCSPAVAAVLEGLDLPAPEEDEGLLLRRIVKSSGRSRAYIGDSAVPVAALRRLAGVLVDYASQHEHRVLLDEARHLAILDSFAGLVSERDAVREAVQSLQSLLEERARLARLDHERRTRQDYLRFQLDELEVASPNDGEMEDLAARRTRLRHAEELVGKARQIEESLYSGGAPALDAISRSVDSLRELAAIDSSLAPLLADLEAALIAVEEVGRDIAAYGRDVRSGPQELEEVEERIATLRHLARKHHCDASDLLPLMQRLRSELDELDGLKERLDDLEPRIDEARSLAGSRARQLGDRRAEAAERLRSAVEVELSSLGMGSACFVPEITPVEEGEDRPALGEGGTGPFVSVSGGEQLHFLLSANPGEEPRPLARVASGGELSRILLAIRRVLAGTSAVQTCVFDEIDTGIGGATAEIVAQKLAAISREHQVLCITHLPQIAAYADHHLRVDKTVLSGRTLTSVLTLDRAESIGELVRMMAGAESTEVAEAFAEELLARARGRRSDRMRTSALIPEGSER